MREAILYRALSVCLLGALAVFSDRSTAQAQNPGEDPGASTGVKQESSLGRIPGDPSPRAIPGALNAPTSTTSTTIAVPRGPFVIEQPRTTPAPSLMAREPVPAVLEPTTLPAFGALSQSSEGFGEGPANGLTLDQAIERLVRGNLDLRARFYEIPLADADILTASLRANPLFYADTQLVPYGSYDKEKRPGGQTQYDINITQPVDLSGKRAARTIVAERAKRVIEAQYQDAVRLQIDNLYTAYVDVLAARATIAFAQASVKGLEEVFKVTKELQKRGNRTRADVNRVKIQLDASRLGLEDAERILVSTRRTLALLLNASNAEAATIDARGSIRAIEVKIPPAEQLASLAISSRPDLQAYRLGVHHAQANVQLAIANRHPDVLLLYQPYTFQDNSPFGQRSAHSWGVGATVTMPLFNRNQGNIQRARLNVDQTRVEVVALQRQIQAEVENAAREYDFSGNAVKRMESEVLPSASQLKDDTYQLYTGGELGLVDFLNAQRDYNEVVRQYRDLAVRHRRGQLRLNSVLGVRLIP